MCKMVVRTGMVGGWKGCPRKGQSLNRTELHLHEVFIFLKREVPHDKTAQSRCPWGPWQETMARDSGVIEDMIEGANRLHLNKPVVDNVYMHVKVIYRSGVFSVSDS